MEGLIIKQIWLDQILSGKKTWEIRGKKTQKRGQIALIQKGSGLIMGVCDLLEVKGPLTHDDLEKTFTNIVYPLIIFGKTLFMRHHMPGF